jgi:hypothetical protein
MRKPPDCRRFFRPYFNRRDRETRVVLPPSIAPTEPPSYCQYSSGPAINRLRVLTQRMFIFFYSSKPEVIADTIEEGGDYDLVQHFGFSLPFTWIWSNRCPLSRMKS